MRKIAALAVILLPVALAGCSHPQPVAYVAPPPPAEYQPPPPSPAAQQGYADGVAAARRDIRAGRAPDVRRHPRFRRPPVPPPAFAEYRQAFRVGYQQVFRGGPPPPPGY